jgi:hypothetical protein
MPIFDRRLRALAFGVAALSALSACASEPDNEELAQVEAAQVRDAAASGRVFCAIAGADAFRLDCTMDRVASVAGTELVLGRADAGYRRFRLVNGVGLVTADGAEPAVVTIIDNGMIEVAVANDRYRLPANTTGNGAAATRTAPN